jgi:hypothetical protein
MELDVLAHLERIIETMGTDFERDAEAVDGADEDPEL